MYRIGIISDTHGVLREEVKQILRSCDAILHGGDIDSQNLLAELMAIAPTTAVQGNNDRNWADPLPEIRYFSLYGLSFCMIHDKKKLPGKPADADIIIYGHSHKYQEAREDGRLWLNPGSCGRRRFGQPLTMALLQVADSGSYQVERIDLPQRAATHAPSPSSSLEELSRTELLKLVQAVIRETDKGVPAEKIAAKCSVSPQVARQLCRLYLTHPGIDAEEILGKLSLS
ncbi:MAG: metallophosphoesterase family protein [Lachnospiraceae bacterium]|nr:metallophosphoesterase family protein [Lachnospiraceae bacterium]MCI9149388.1 metallophosphoesterase family protein [Lachnospiraceae bacterium]